MIKKFKLQNVIFADGGYVEGTFEFDTASQKYQNINITLDGPILRTSVQYNGDHYTFTDNDRIEGNQTYLSLCQGACENYHAHMRLEFVEALSDSTDEVTIKINTQTESYSYYRLNGVGASILTTGNIFYLPEYQIETTREVVWESSGGKDYKTENNPSFTYRLDKKSKVVFDLESETVDTYLYLLDALGETKIAENDDINLISGNRNSRIIIELLPGTYKLVAGSYAPEKKGHGTIKASTGILVDNEWSKFIDFKLVKGDIKTNPNNIKIPDGYILATRHDVAKKKRAAKNAIIDWHKVRLAHGYVVTDSRWGISSIKDPDPNEPAIYTLCVKHERKNSHSSIYSHISLTEDYELVIDQNTGKSKLEKIEVSRAIVNLPNIRKLFLRAESSIKVNIDNEDFTLTETPQPISVNPLSKIIIIYKSIENEKIVIPPIFLQTEYMDENEFYTICLDTPTFERIREKKGDSFKNNKEALGIDKNCTDEECDHVEKALRMLVDIYHSTYKYVNNGNTLSRGRHIKGSNMDHLHWEFDQQNGITPKTHLEISEIVNNSSKEIEFFSDNGSQVFFDFVKKITEAPKFVVHTVENFATNTKNEVNKIENFVKKESEDLSHQVYFSPQ